MVLSFLSALKSVTIVPLSFGISAICLATKSKVFKFSSSFSASKKQTLSEAEFSKHQHFKILLTR